jgi:hypothetical protein
LIHDREDGGRIRRGKKVARLNWRGRESETVNAAGRCVQSG